MVPTSREFGRWLCGELSHVLIGPGPEQTRELARALGRESLSEDVRALLLTANEGVSGSVALTNGVRVLAWAGPEGAQVAVVAPDALAEQAAGVTHEVANALTAIAGWVRLAGAADRGEALPPRTRDALDVIGRSVEDALRQTRGLLESLRDRGSPGIGPTAPADVAEVVEDVLTTLRPELEAASITVETDLAEHVYSTMNTAELRLVVSNVVRNAYEAFAGAAGTIRVSLEALGRQLRLTVNDNGPGMSESTLASAFDRYFTTKDAGTGLGLAMVRDTVREAGGRIQVQSRRSQGTRFHILLPALGSAPLSARPPAVRVVRSGVHARSALLGRRVLVVDDDLALRSLVRTALELQGARVTECASRAEADSPSVADGPRFDVALIDLNLRDGSGEGLIAALRLAGRANHVVLMTGAVDPQLQDDARPDAVLQKPFELDELDHLVLSLLEDGARISP